MAALTFQQAFDSALRHHQAGQLRQAEELYRQVLARQSNHADALYRLGLIALQRRQYDIARDLIRRAIELRPDWPEACGNLGVALKNMGQLNEAIAFQRQAIALRPDFPEAHANLGSALKEQGRFDEAIASYRQAIALRPNLAEAHSNLGNALQARGQLDEAIASYRQAIALRPRYPEAHGNLGVALNEKGQLDEAIASYHQAITCRPNYPEAYNNLGVAMKDNRRFDEAITAFHLALALKPNYPEAHCNLGNALKDNGQLDEGVASYRQAIALDSNYAMAYANLGNALWEKGQLDEAIAAYRQAIAVKPSYLKGHDDLVLTLYYHPGYDARAIADEQRRWDRQHAEPLRGEHRAHANDRDPDRRLRIGYASADFRAHASAHFLVPLLARHDPKEVELFCYAEVPRPDAMTAHMRQSAAHWRSTVGLSDAQVAQAIRDDRIDILVDLKLHTARNRLLVFARKPAPVQVTWLGYPGSTGLTAIDYRLSDPYLDPFDGAQGGPTDDAQGKSIDRAQGMDETIYSEQTIRLPDSFWCYDPLDGRDIPVNALPALRSSNGPALRAGEQIRGTGVPPVFPAESHRRDACATTPGIVTFGSLNNFYKVNEPVLRLWARVLEQVKGSRLLLMADRGSHRQRTFDFLKERGVEPDRVEFVPRQSCRQYLESYHRIDLVLDTFPYNGHTTSLDSLWMGVPVVSLAGKTAVGRGGLSILSNVGLPELVARSEEEYVQIAVDLARDLPRLSRLRAELRPRMEQSPLMDAPLFARNMEAVYRRMWRTWAGGEMLNDE